MMQATYHLPEARQALLQHTDNHAGTLENFDSCISQWQGAQGRAPENLDLLVRAIVLTAEMREMRRKEPIISHTLRVAQVLWMDGQIRDATLLACAILHHWTPDQVKDKFNDQIHDILAEFDAEPNFAQGSKEEREIVINRAPTLTGPCLDLKMADRLDSIRQRALTPASPEKTVALDWEEKLLEAVTASKKANQTLLAAVKKAIEEARR